MTDRVFAGQLPRLPLLSRLPGVHGSSGAFNAIAPDLLDELGFEEEEFLVTGLANIYGYDSGWKLRVSEADVPYTTQIVVRRPADPARFSGNVVIELMHQGFPRGVFSFFWERFADNGDAHVVVLRGPDEAEMPRMFNADRYRSLNMSDQGLAWDFFAQVCALLKDDSPGAPLAGYGERFLFATGASGNAVSLLTFLGDGFHERWRLADGRPLIDGYLPMIAQGTMVYGAIRAPRHNPSFLGQFNHPYLQIPWGDPRRRVSGHDVPVLHVITEAEVLVSAEPMPLQDWGAPGTYNLGLPLTVEDRLHYRRSDSDAPNDRYWLWEIAGAAHGSVLSSGDPMTVLRATPAEQRQDMSQIFGEPDYPSYGPREPLNEFPGRYLTLLAWECLFRWVREGKTPPQASRIEVNPDTLEIRRDEHGNAIGGVRSPYVDVPTATYRGTNPGTVLAGSMKTFSRDKLRDLYGDHDSYVRAFHARTDELAAAGWVASRDVDALKDSAATSKRLF